MNKKELQSLIREEIKKIVKESSIDTFKKQYMQGNTSNAHPFVLRAMEELKDDLDFYLGPKNQYAGSKIDFDLLKKKMAELAKLIKQYQ